MKTLVFDVDRGMTSVVRKHGLDHGALIDVLPVENWSEFQADLTALVTTKHPYQLVVIDTATELAKLILGEVTKVGTTIVTPEIQHWGKLETALEHMARILRKAPFHTLLLAHESLVTDKGGNRYYQPNFKGNFNVEFAKHFDVIARMFLVDQQVLTDGVPTTVSTRWLNCQRDEYTNAKDRFMTLDKFEWPDYGLDYLFGKLLKALSAGETQT